MSIKTVRNTTANTISITDTGVSLAPYESFTIDARNYGEWAQSSVKTSYINSGAIVVEEDGRALTPLAGLQLLNDDIAFKIGFESNPERMNGFTAKNVQEAIEESFNTNIGEHQSVVFLNNGATSNKWLLFFSSSASSDMLPLVCYADVTINQWSYINTTNNTDIDLDIYKNGVYYFTVEIRNKRWAYSNETNIPTNSFVMGDRISVFAKKVNGGTGVIPNSVLFRFNLQTISNNFGSGGAQSGV